MEEDSFVEMSTDNSLKKNTYDSIESRWKILVMITCKMFYHKTLTSNERLFCRSKREILKRVCQAKIAFNKESFNNTKEGI